MSSLEQEVNVAFMGKLSRIPWVMRAMTGETVSTEEVSEPELIHGLTLMVRGLHENVLRLAREIDSLR